MSTPKAHGPVKAPGVSRATAINTAIDWLWNNDPVYVTCTLQAANVNIHPHLVDESGRLAV